MFVLILRSAKAQQAPQTRASVRASRRMRTAAACALMLRDASPRAVALGRLALPPRCGAPQHEGEAILRTRAFAEKRLERVDIFLLAREVARDLLVEMRGAEIELVPGRIFADELGDLVHLRNPAVGFWRHLRQAALEPCQ